MSRACKAQHQAFGIKEAIKRGDEEDGARLLEDSCKVAVHASHEQAGILQVRTFSCDECAQHRRDERGTNSMPHHIADKDASLVIGDAHDVEEIAADHAGGMIKMRETK